MTDSEPLDIDLNTKLGRQMNRSMLECYRRSFRDLYCKSYDIASAVQKRIDAEGPICLQTLSETERVAVATILSSLAMTYTKILMDDFFSDTGLEED